MTDDIKPEIVATEPETVTAATATVDSEAPEAKTAAPKPSAKKKKAQRTVPYGHMHVLATFNNTIITFTDPRGEVLTSASAGGCGFRGSKKGTAYAAQVATEKAGQAAKQQFGIAKVDIYVRGVGLGRDAAVRTMQNLDIKVEMLADVTGVPHGGVRPTKRRRV